MTKFVTGRLDLTHHGCSEPLKILHSVHALAQNSSKKALSS